jgi:hypothetical protein
VLRSSLYVLCNSINQVVRDLVDSKIRQRFLVNTEYYIHNERIEGPSLTTAQYIIVIILTYSPYEASHYVSKI